jgi:hypothetical protein
VEVVVVDRDVASPVTIYKREKKKILKEAGKKSTYLHEHDVRKEEVVGGIYFKSSVHRVCAVHGASTSIWCVP